MKPKLIAIFNRSSYPFLDYFMQNEHQRLLAVNRFKHMVAGIHQDLDNMAALVAQICETPVGLVTIIDETTQWFKARLGLDIDCGAREESFCNVTIEQDDLLIVPDTSADERFKELPAVVNNPHVRFYAGAPLTTYDGHAVGTVCVLDVVPRQLSEAQQNALRIIAKQVLNILELNWSLRSLSEQHQECERQKLEIEQYSSKLRAVFNNSKDIHLLLDKGFHILAFNKAANKHFMSYYNKPLLLGESILNYVNPANAKRLMVYFSNALSGISYQTDWEFTLHEQKYWLNVCFSPIYTENMAISGVSATATDITLTKRHEARVEKQSAALQRISTIQSNELRKPVATLMGIIDLVKDEPAFSGSDYLPMLASAVDELDGKLKDIVKEAETTAYSKGPVA